MDTLMEIVYFLVSMIQLMSWWQQGLSILAAMLMFYVCVWLPILRWRARKRFYADETDQEIIDDVDELFLQMSEAIEQRDIQSRLEVGQQNLQACAAHLDHLQSQIGGANTELVTREITQMRHTLRSVRSGLQRHLKRVRSGWLVGDMLQVKVDLVLTDLASVTPEEAKERRVSLPDMASAQAPAKERVTVPHEQY